MPYGTTAYGTIPYGGTGAFTPPYVPPPVGPTEPIIFQTPVVRDRPPFLPDSPPRGYALMRHYENRLRGVIVWELDDGTFAVDTPCNYEAAQTQPAAFFSDDPSGPDEVEVAPGLTNTNAPYPWNPFPGSTNSMAPGSYSFITNWDHTTEDFILEPHAVEWFQPAANNVVTQEDALALTAAGFGDCLA